MLPPPNGHKRPDPHAIYTVEDVLEQVCYPGRSQTRNRRLTRVEERQKLQ